MSTGKPIHPTSFRKTSTGQKQIPGPKVRYGGASMPQKSEGNILFSSIPGNKGPTK